MPGPPDGSCARAGEQRLLIQGLVWDGAIHAAPRSRSGREVGASAQLQQNILLFWGGGGEQCYLNKSSVDDWDGYSCSWQWQLNPKNVCVPQPRPPCLLILPGGSAGREMGFA